MAVAIRGTGPASVADWDDDPTVVVMAVLDDAYGGPGSARTASINAEAPTSATTTCTAGSSGATTPSRRNS